MRILHVYSGNLYGGVETMLVTLARHRNLCPAMELDFALCFEGSLSAELASADAPVHLLGHVRISRLWQVWQARRRFSNLFQRRRFDLVICHSPWSQAVFGPVVRSAGLPLVVWLHGPTEGRHWLERLARMTQPDLVLCNSHFTAGASANMFPHAQTEVVYYPVAPPKSDYTHAERLAVRAELKTSENATVIVQVSRMEAWKGHQLHLEALGLLGDLPSWVCWQVGGAQRPHEAQYLKELKNASTRLGIAPRVHFLGQRSDVSRLLAAADIHCQPNTGPEPFGITFVEALYARLPVVTTAIGGAKEIVDDSCGVLVPPGDAYALATSLRRLIQDPGLRANLGANGPQRAQELCDPATQMARLNELLTSVVCQKRVG